MHLYNLLIKIENFSSLVYFDLNNFKKTKKLILSDNKGKWFKRNSSLDKQKRKTIKVTTQ